MQAIPTSPLCPRGLTRPAPSDEGCAQLNGSGWAAVQALGVSRNTGLSRRMVPEAEASRLSLRPQGVHGPKQRKTDICPHRHVLSTWTPNGARTVTARGTTGSETHRAAPPVGRQGELPEDTDDPNRKALATEETQEDPEDGSDRNNSEFPRQLPEAVLRAREVSALVRTSQIRTRATGRK